MTRILVGVSAFLALVAASLWVMNARLDAKLSTTTEENKELRLSIERTTAAHRADQVLMEAQFKTVRAFDAKLKELNEYVEAMPEGRAECLTPADVDRLRELWD